MQRMLRELPSGRTVDSHNKIQTGERPFFCKFGKQISRGDNQKVHLHTHGGRVIPKLVQGEKRYRDSMNRKCEEDDPIMVSLSRVISPHDYFADTFMGPDLLLILSNN